MMMSKNNNIEDMLSQLITMVAAIQVEHKEMKQALEGMHQEQKEMKPALEGMHQEQKEMKQAFAGMLQEQKEMKRVQQEMQNKIEEIETKAEERHKEILDQMTALKHDQDFIWEKTVRHEREIHAIKMKLS